MKELLNRISQEGLVLDLKDGALQLFSTSDTVNESLITEIKSRKEEIISYLSRYEVTSSPAEQYPQIQPCAPQESYPITASQMGVWIANQMEGSAAAYNMPNQLVLDGSFDVVSFQKAIHAVIERHQILRTVFRPNEAGQIHQYILSPQQLPFRIAYHDLRQQEDPAAAARHYASTDYRQPFDLAQGPLLRAALLQLADEQYVFYYNMHHIISDGWSTGVLSRDVMSYYQHYTAGTALDLPALRIQYKDYARWQLDQLDTPAYESHKTYWLERLRTPIPPLELPTTLRRPAVKTFGGQRIGTHLSAELTQQLRRFTSETGGSLFMGLLAAWKVLLYRYTGQTDLTVGNPVAGREHPDLEDQIGFYINTLALRDQLEPHQSFLATYQAIKANTLAAYAHQMYPFDALLEGLKVHRDIGRNPLFDLLIDYEGAAPAALPYPPLQELGTGKVKFDLELDITEVAGGLNLTLGYNTQVYTHPMVQGLLGHFGRLLEAVLASPNTPIGSVSFLSEQEVRTLRQGFNPPAVAPPFESLVARFAQQVRRQPEAIALVCGHQQLTYGQLDERSSQLAAWLLRRGIGADSLVGLHLERSLELLIGLVGILKAGAAYVPIDVDCPPERFRFLLEDAACPVLLSQQSLAYRVEELDQPPVLLCLDDPADWAQPPLADLPPIRADQLAYVIYTSGTTGRPKGVLIEHGSLSAYLRHQSAYFGIEAGEAVLLFASVAFDASVEQLGLALCNGARLVIATRSELLDRVAFSRLLSAQQISHLHAVPSFLATLAVDSGEHLRRIVSAGEPFDAALWSTWSGRVALYNKYGPTEATISASECQVLDDRHPSSIGRPLGSSQCYVLGWAQTLQPVGVVGEICIGGPGLARGYLNQPGLTAEKFIANPFQPGERLYRTGDLGSWSWDGQLQFHGRQDHQVKIRGYRIELEEIEGVLNGLPTLVRSAVVAVKDPHGASHLVAFVVSRELVDAQSLREGLLLLLEEQLPSYMVPQHYVSLRELPLTASGKVDRSRLPIPDSLGRHQVYEAPVTATEQALAGIWQQVLGVEQVGLHDNFFELGGNSLNAIKINSSIKKNLFLDVDIKTLFVLKTIGELAFQIDFSEKQKAIKQNNRDSAPSFRMKI